MPKCFLKTVGDFRLRCQHTYRHITDIGINLFEYINDVIEKTIEWQPNTPLENLPPPRQGNAPPCCRKLIKESAIDVRASITKQQAKRGLDHGKLTFI